MRAGIAMEPDKQLPPHVAAVFKDAVDNIRFFRGQQWVVANFVIAINGVIYLFAESLPGPARVFLTALAAATFLYGVFLLIDFQRAISDFRRRREWIYQRYFTGEERRALELLKLRPLLREPVIGMIAVMAFVCVIGAAYVLSTA